MRAESQSVGFGVDQELIQISPVSVLHPRGDDDGDEDEALWPTSGR